MADPLSTVANAAAIVGLAEVTFRATKQLYVFFSAVKGASKEVKSLQNELQDINTILRLLSADNGESPNLPVKLLKIPEVEHILKRCQEVLDILQKIADDSTAKPGDSSVKKFEKRLQWVFDDKKIEQASKLLEKYKLTLVAALSIIGKRDYLNLRQEILEGLADSRKTALANHATLLRNIGQLASNSDRHFENTKMTIGAFQQESTRKLDNIQNTVTTVHTAVNTATQSVQTTATEIRNDVAKGQIASSERHDKVQHELLSISSQLAEIRLTQVSGDDSITFEGCNLEAITLPLMLLKPDLYGAISHLAREERTQISTADADWFQSEFESLLAAAHTQSASAARKRSTSSGGVLSSVIGSSGQFRSYRNNGSACSPPALNNIGRRQKNKRMYRAQQPWSHRLSLSIGYLSIGVDETVTDKDDSFNTERQLRFVMTFLPRPSSISIAGVKASFARRSKGSFEWNITPHISSFAVVSEYSPVIEFVEDGEIYQIIELFKAGLASPNDRVSSEDPDCRWYGRPKSLLEIAAFMGNAKMCQFLLQEGADCDTNPIDDTDPVESLSSGFWEEVYSYDTTEYRSSIEYASRENERWIDVLRLLVGAGYDPAEALEERGVGLISANISSSDDRRTAVSTKQVSEYFGYLQTLSYTIDYRDKEGATPFLKAACTPQPKGACMLMDLLKNGASPHAVDIGGNGALHCSLCSWGGDRMEPERFTLLFRAGCSINIGNNVGYTPSDIAVRPKQWGAWCIALEQWGLNIEDVLEADERLHKVPRNFPKDMTNGTEADANGGVLDNANIEGEADVRLLGSCICKGLVRANGICDLALFSTRTRNHRTTDWRKKRNWTDSWVDSYCTCDYPEYGPRLIFTDCTLEELDEMKRDALVDFRLSKRLWLWLERAWDTLCSCVFRSLFDIIPIAVYEYFDGNALHFQLCTNGGFRTRIPSRQDITPPITIQEMHARIAEALVSYPDLLGDLREILDQQYAITGGHLSEQLFCTLLSTNNDIRQFHIGVCGEKHPLASGSGTRGYPLHRFEFHA